MSKGWIVIHLIIVAALSCVVIYYINDDVCTQTSDYISGVGSVASVYAILMTLWQLIQVKTAAEAAKDAVEKKTKEMEAFIAFAEVNRHIEVTNTVTAYLAANQEEAAAIKIEQLKEELINLKQNGDLSTSDYKTANIYVIKLGTDVSAIRKKIAGLSELDTDMVISHVTDVCTFLQEVSSKIRRTNI